MFKIRIELKIDRHIQGPHFILEEQKSKAQKTKVS